MVRKAVFHKRNVIIWSYISKRPKSGQKKKGQKSTVLSETKQATKNVRLLGTLTLTFPLVSLTGRRCVLCVFVKCVLRSQDLGYVRSRSANGTCCIPRADCCRYGATLTDDRVCSIVTVSSCEEALFRRCETGFLLQTYFIIIIIDRNTYADHVIEHTNGNMPRVAKGGQNGEVGWTVPKTVTQGKRVAG